MPNSHTQIENHHPPDWEALAEECYELLPNIVQHICYRCYRVAPPEAIEDYRGEMMLYLLKYDSHNLKTYEPGKGSLKTWLFTVTEHELRDQFRHERTWDSLDETVIEQLSELPQQERNVITQANQEALAREVAKLSARQQELFALLCAGFTAQEIAEQLHIKAASVHRMKYELIQKIKAGIEKKRGGQISCQSGREEK